MLKTKQSREAALAALFEPTGYMRADPALLQPADIFLELSGEDIRRRLFLTYDGTGREFCLRPEFTIPVARAYLADMPNSMPANYWYCGPVFRHRAQGSGEFLQGGIESLGRSDRAAADAETLDLALQACHALGVTQPSIAVGDVGLLGAFLEALQLPPDTMRRLRRRLASGQNPAEFLAEPEADNVSGVGDYGGLLGALEGIDKQQARAFVEDVLSIAGLENVGGRSISDIAERFLAKVERGQSDLSGEKAGLIGAFLALGGHPDEVSAKARRLCQDAGIGIDAALDEFDTRTGFMAARGIAVETLKATTAFTRNMDYYTGFVFEVTQPEPRHGQPGALVAGGRYDKLLTRLGASEPLPAIGCAIWVERFGEPA
jgi:ATP phosphoribosyltransferase regulatory subunit